MYALVSMNFVSAAILAGFQRCAKEPAGCHADQAGTTQLYWQMDRFCLQAPHPVCAAAITCPVAVTLPGSLLDVW